VTEGPVPVPPRLRPVDGRQAGAAGSGGDQSRAVLREFGANRAAMAAEISRLRAMLQDALYELSRVAAGSAALTTPSPPPGTARTTPARPFGFGP
jgi:uncharacterized membrane protein YccC